VRLLFDQNLSPRLVRLLADIDADFHQRSLLLGQPPKVIWIRLGNCSAGESAALLRNRSVVVHSFYEDADASFLALGP
jgi:predicted nuclease of predicted toxin-antitoxin system